MGIDERLSALERGLVRRDSITVDSMQKMTECVQVRDSQIVQQKF